MPFRINGFEVGGNFYSLPKSRQSGDNRISIFVGPNGVGKTNLLVEMAYHFTERKRPRGGNPKFNSNPFVSLKTGSEVFPVRVVTQTFSPFSRFPKERSRALGLKDYLIDGDERYATIGFTRGMGLQGSVSRVAVSRVIRKLFTRPEHARPLAKAMESLGFFPLLTLGFVSTHSFGGRVALEKNELRQSINEYIFIIKNKSRHSFDEQKLVREFQNEPDAELAVRIERSLLTLQHVSVEKRLAGNVNRNEYMFDVSLRAPQRNQELLEAVLTLNRIGLLRISSCLLTPNGENEGWLSNKELFPGKIDIADASSGQQQLLSSLFGIVAEVEDNSLILIDEPELSLHPVWQTQFIDLLVDALSGIQGCHVFIATHSALVAQRAQELSLDIISLGKQIPSGNQEVSQGVSIDQTLLDTFEVAVRKSAYVPRLLLSLVMQAESGKGDLNNIQLQLNRIERIYADSKIEDKHIIELIASAKENVANVT